MGNSRLAKQAIIAVTADWSEKSSGYCQRFVKQVLQSTYGNTFDKYAKASAKLSAYSWRDGDWAEYEVINHPKPEDTQEGDILYRTIGSGGFGHVGIRVKGGPRGNGGVVENSSVHWDGEDARGIRDIYDFFLGSGVQYAVRILI